MILTIITEWLKNPTFYVLLVTILGIVGKIISNWFKNKKIKSLREKLNRDLYPKFQESDIVLATTNFINPRFHLDQPDYIKDEEKFGVSGDIDKSRSDTKNLESYDLISEFVEDIFLSLDESKKYYLVFASMGMGKTVAMLNLYLKYKNKYAYKADKFDIEIFPLGRNETYQEISAIQNKKQTILLLDAFDEDVKAIEDYNNRWKELSNIVEPFRKVIISCRTQFFPSEFDEPEETEDYTDGIVQKKLKFNKVYLSEFREKDIHKYLRKVFKFPSIWHLNRYFKARKIVRESKNLMVRPMLLYYINSLVSDYKDQYKYQYNVYKILIDNWINNESSKAHYKKMGIDSFEYKEILHSIASNLARNIYENWETRGILAINRNQMAPDEVRIIDTLHRKDEKQFGKSNARNYPLLLRDGDGNYKFAHRSILEFFIAEEAFNNRQLHINIRKDNLYVVSSFIKEMAFLKIIKASPGRFKIARRRIDLQNNKQNDFINYDDYNKRERENPLSLLRFSELDEISELKIEIDTDIDLHVFTPCVGKKLRKLIIINNDYDLLYFLYSATFNQFYRNDKNSTFIRFELNNFESILEYYGFRALLRKFNEFQSNKAASLNSDLSLDSRFSVNKYLSSKSINDYSLMLSAYHQVYIDPKKRDYLESASRLIEKHSPTIERLRDINVFLDKCTHLQKEFESTKLSVIF